MTMSSSDLRRLTEEAVKRGLSGDEECPPPPPGFVLVGVITDGGLCLCCYRNKAGDTVYQLCN